MTPLETFLSAAPAIPGREANQTFWDLRAAAEAQYGRATLLELVLPDAADLEHVRNTLLPRLLLHLGPLPARQSAGWLLTPVWYRGQAYAFDAPSFLRALAAALAISEQDLLHPPLRLA